MCNDMSSFTTISNDGIEQQKPDVETAKRDGKVHARGHGTILLESEHGGICKTMLLKEAAYVPDLRTNLISVPEMQKNGLRVTFPPNSTKVIVSKDNSTLMIGTTAQHNIAELSGVTATEGRSKGKLRYAYISTTADVSGRRPKLKLATQTS